MPKKDLKISEGEHKFMDVVWDVCPAKSQVLVDACLERYNWNKSTTYTLMRRMAAQGLVVTENTIVSPLVTKEEELMYESNRAVETRFEGSLPNFIAAFLSKKKLSEEDAVKIRKLIEKNS